MLNERAQAAPVQPEEVICGLRESDDYIRAIFMNGGCWQFHKFLKLLYPKAEPFKVAIAERNAFDHIVTKIGRRFYDITGMVEASDFYSCVPVESKDIPEFEKWSFARNNLLFKRCPHCGEEVLINRKGKICKS